MKRNKKIIVLLVAALLGSFYLSGCNLMRLLNPPPTPIPPTPEPLTELTICLGYEPDSLYPYKAASQAAREVLQAIYDGPIDIPSSGVPEPVILTKMPSLSDGSAFFTPVSIADGDEVVNTYGDLVALQPGTRVFPSGCTSPTCAVAWDGAAPLQVDQLTASYELMDGLKWSDGQPLTASDSLYAFQVASDPATPVSKHAVDQTASYTVVNDTTIEWVGKPGLVTDAFEDYFWAPMPEHAWGGYTADELLDAEEVNRSPLGWGAYAVEEWVDGEFIRLVKNTHYFRANEGLPLFEILTFKITNPNGDTNLSNLKFNREPFEHYGLGIGSFKNSVAEDGCDLISTTVNMRDQLFVLNMLTSYYKDPSIKIFKGESGDQDILVFNLREEYESFNSDLNKKSNPLTTPEIRSAIENCIDEQKVDEKIFYGFYDPAVIKDTFNTYDPTKGIEILDNSGWFDHDGDRNTARIKEDPNGDQGNTSLTFSYLIINSEENIHSAELFKQSLAECGIDIIIKPVPPEVYWNPTEDVSIFKGKFDLAQVKWSSIINNPCPFLTTIEIPDSENGYSGLNISGYSNPETDTLCTMLQENMLKEERDQIHDTIKGIILNDKPMLFLYSYKEMLVTREDFCSDSVKNEVDLRFLEELNYGDTCDLSP